MTLTAERARELLRYDPETGDLYRRILPRRGPKRANIGLPVGTKDTWGYLQVRLDGRNYMVARIIWLMQTGAWPNPTVDHINRVRDDNRWCNLREATHREQMLNRAPFKWRVKPTSLPKLRTFRESPDALRVAAALACLYLEAA